MTEKRERKRKMTRVSGDVELLPKFYFSKMNKDEVRFYNTTPMRAFSRPEPFVIPN